MYPYDNFRFICLLIVVSVFFPGCSAINVPYTDLPRPVTKGSVAIHFIDVGQGDSVFINLSSGENILIDAGSPSGGPEIVRYLKDIGVRKISHLIFTHPHDDHIGGVFSILSELEVDRFYDNGFNNFSSTIYGDYIRLVRDKLSRYNVLQAGETLLVEDLKIEVLNPLLPPTGNLNEDSIVLRIHFGDIAILLSGDIGQIGERRILNTDAGLSSQVLKISHHGENDVCSDEFLKRVDPETAIISVGVINKYARPHPELLDRLSEAGIVVYRTDRNGHIVLVTNGKTYSIKTEK